MTEAIALDCRDITVTYGAVTALSGVAVRFAKGMIHAVVGQNGAGKTTFARVAAGLVRPAVGQVLINGKPVRGGSVKQARQAGVELVHQSFALPPSFTVAEAMEFGASGAGGLYSRRRLEARWKAHLGTVNVDVDPRRRIRDLPVETQQGVEIARALVTDASVLILDEPTAVLSPSGIEKLFERVRRLKARGVTVILILHKIREVLAVADTVTVLRGGKLIEAAVPCAGIDPPRLADVIIGTAAARTLAPEDKQAAVGAAPAQPAAQEDGAVSGEALLRLEAVSSQADAEGPALDNVSLTIRPGEIVGVAGVEGNGQRTLVRAIANLVPLDEGRIALDGRDVTAASLAERRLAGLRIIPFERNTEGLSLSSSLWENWSARLLMQASMLSTISPRACGRVATTP